MKKFHLVPYYVSILLLMAFVQASAQSSKQVIATLTPPPASIKIDGSSKEWGDSLHYYNAEKGINYDIANTKDTLYFAIRTNDRTQQARILHAGFTLSVDTKGKKKEEFSITFPLSNGEGGAFTPTNQEDGDISAEDRNELMVARITKLRGIKVTGFKDVENEMITTANTYGFKTAINYDDNGYLVCEAAVPISLFHADTKNEWAFDFKINGVQRPSGNKQGGDEGGGRHNGGMGGGAMGGGRGGHHGGGGMQGEGDHTELAKSVDFWEKFYLGKN